MDKDRANSILQTIKSMDEPFGELSELIQGIPDETERKQYARRLGDTFGMIYTEIMFPIIREHPELDPDRSDQEPT